MFRYNTYNYAVQWQIFVIITHCSSLDEKMVTTTQGIGLSCGSERRNQLSKPKMLGIDADKLVAFSAEEAEKSPETLILSSGTMAVDEGISSAGTTTSPTKHCESTCHQPGSMQPRRR